jgi:hypothetical protein
MSLFYYVNSKFASHSASVSCLSLASFTSRKICLRIQGKESARVGGRSKRWITSNSQHDVEKRSRADILQIHQSHKGLLIPDEVRANLSVTEEAFLNDLSTFEAIYPQELMTDDFQIRNERIKAGGVMMGNDREKMAHKDAIKKANSILEEPIDHDHEYFRRVYLDTVSSSHICSMSVTELQQILIKDLTEDSINNGKILWVKIEEPCYRLNSSSAITALVKDSEGTLISLVLHNILPPGSTTNDAQKYLPIGTQIGIKEPYSKCFLSGYLGLRVDNPCNLEIEISNLILPDLKALCFDPFQQDKVVDYYGPIEIRDAGKKGRGIFLTKDVKKGFDDCTEYTCL